MIAPRVPDEQRLGTAPDIEKRCQALGRQHVRRRHEYVAARLDRLTRHLQRAAHLSHDYRSDVSRVQLKRLLDRKAGPRKHISTDAGFVAAAENRHVRHQAASASSCTRTLRNRRIAR